MLKYRIFQNIRKAIKRNRQKRICKSLILELNDLDNIEFHNGLNASGKNRYKVIEAELLALRIELGQKTYNTIYESVLKTIWTK